MIVDVLAQVGNHAPAGHMGHVTAQELEHTADQVDAQNGEGERGNQLVGLWGSFGIGDYGDELLDCPRDEELDPDEEKHAQDGYRQDFDVTTRKKEG